MSNFSVKKSFFDKLNDMESTINAINLENLCSSVFQLFIAIVGLFKLLTDVIFPSPLRDVVVISGRSCLHLSDSICSVLDKPLGNKAVSIIDFANTETNVKLLESVRGKDIFIVETGASFEGRSVNDHVMELILLEDACRRSSANSITVITPFFPYARADKKDHRGPISSKKVMDMIMTDADRIVTVDLHAAQIQSFTSKPCDNLYCVNLFCNYLREQIFVGVENINDKFILISPDAGGEKRIKAYSEKLKLNSTTLTKQRDYSTVNAVMNSTLTGDPKLVNGKIAIVIDDMVDTMGTMIEGIKELKKYGVDKVIVIASHGVLSGPAIDRINACEDIMHVIVTNSISQVNNIPKCDKLVVLDLGPYLAEVIKRLMTGESLSELFDKK